MGTARRSASNAASRAPAWCGSTASAPPPGWPFAGDAYKAREIREVPKTLREALDCLDRSAVLRAALGDAVIDHYLHAGRWEQFEYDRRVTDHELIRGFERA